MKYNRLILFSAISISILFTSVAFASPYALQNSTNASTPSSNEVYIAKGAGSGANGNCATNNCYVPNPLLIMPGTEVKWKNTDAVGHTVTSGNPSDNETGTIFDSNGLIKPGAEFKFTFQNPGTYNYFCQVNPWMIGQIIVGSGGPNYTPNTGPTLFTSTQQNIEDINQAKTSQTIAAEVNVRVDKTNTTSFDNSVSVQTTINNPDSLDAQVSAPDQTGPKVIMFDLADTTSIVNLNDLGIMYDGKPISSTPNLDAILHAKPTDNPSFAIVVVQSGIQVLVLVPHFSTHTITITNMSKVTFTVPEFGPITALILAIAIVSSIILSAKTGLMSRFSQI